ncbi:hypothetical protein NSK_005239 [Nannochloropsis salina CCMP1776]|uniref:Uncharacterized protein n=1 Tax=Nannochloropsis salina CCMP1776 TaxID=1027361 RepID=A0A4D9CWA4_9STRA|nr:hypothetical protein NSK_005239 [Nannochloropsis salina CCMP1776]|eukprot:TFJ83470.1 hypothetical protein NSK_005239 [Nannochloropsis salina CCMP1776]
MAPIHQASRAPPPSLPTKVRRKLVGHRGPIYTIRFNEKGTYCMTGGQDKSIKLWNPFRPSADANKAGEAMLVQTFTGPHGYEIRDVAITTDNARFASCGGDTAFYLWDVATARVVKKFSGHAHMINSLAFNAEGTVVLSGSYDRTVKIWDLRSNNRDPIQTLDDFKDSVTRVMVLEEGGRAGKGPGGKEVLATSVDGCLRTYDIRKGVMWMDDCKEPLSSVSVSGDGQCVLMNGLDGVVRLLERSTGEMLNNYQGHTHQAYPIESCFDNTDGFVLSGSEDGSLYVWDLVEGGSEGGKEGKPVAVLKEHKRALGSMSFHPSEPVLVTAGYDGVGCCWFRETR